MKSIKEKIHSKIIVKDDCWEWKDALDKDGYGSLGIMVNGKQNKMRAHRVSFEEFVEKVKPGNYVLHKCHNRKCVNPKHLYQGSQKDNCDDCVNSGRSLKGSKHSGAILSELDVLAIREQLAKGEMSSVIADRFGIHKTTVSAIAKKRIWKHI